MYILIVKDILLILKNIFGLSLKKNSVKDSEQSRMGYMVVTKLSPLLKRISTFWRNMLLKFNQCQKFCKTLCLIYADLESLI